MLICNVAGNKFKFPQLFGNRNMLMDHGWVEWDLSAWNEKDFDR